MNTTEYTIYFAGELFDHKHLIGNSLLADRIELLSGKRYRCILPQDLEQTDSRAVDIRNQDLLGVATCDCALFNFDGPDLDSGTVVEFVYAKLLDIPAVILRTDFRGGGDQDTDGDAWNLMASFYPRTRNVSLNAMAWYQQARREADNPMAAAALYADRIARKAIDALDAARAEPSLLNATPDDVEHLYRWALTFPGGGLADRAAGEESLRAAVHRIVSSKTSRNLL
ncbi:MAG: nucleoside 2-deoxyribosyltransferase [Chloroflexota bacterium]|nr:nucleoside 2-deoxyribosyltransferase [Chloroflexota bacterium]